MAELTLTAIIIFAALLIIAVYKTIHFFTCIRVKKFKYWLYFDKMHIVNSSSETSEKAKKRQNSLTVWLFILFVVELIVLFMIHRSN